MIASPPEIKKKRKLSNPQIDIYNSLRERVLFMAGLGSGKTFILAIRAMKYIIKFPEIIGLICANTYQQLSKSTLKRCFDTWKSEFGMINGVHYVVDKIPPAHWPKFHEKLKSYENTICFNNGCLIFTFSLDNYTTIDGTEVGWGQMDETKNTKEEAIKETVVGRLRQKGMFIDQDNRLINQKNVDGFLESGVYSEIIEDNKIRIIENATGRHIVSHNPLSIFTSPAKVLWLNEWFSMPEYYDEIAKYIFVKTEYFHRDTGREEVVISSTYHNEENLSENYIENLLADYKGNPHLAEMNIYGSPIAKSGGEFYHQFNRLKHIGPTRYNPNAYLDVSFDFNVIPYISATVSQILWDEGKNKYIVQFIKEYALKAPRNNSEDLSNAILLDWQRHKTGVRIFGDASGKNRQTISKEFRHNYAVIEHILRSILAADYHKVTRSNPALIKRRDFANKMLAGGYDIEIIVDPSCKKTITDFEFVKEAPDGGKLKEMTKDSHTGESYQKLGHHSDTVDYFLCSAFENYFNPG